MKIFAYLLFLLTSKCALTSNQGKTYDCGGDTAAELACIFAENELWVANYNRDQFV